MSNTAIETKLTGVKALPAEREVTVHPQSPYLAPPSAVSNMGSLEVVQGLPGADTQEAPSVPTSETNEPGPTPGAATGADLVHGVPAFQRLDVEAQVYRDYRNVVSFLKEFHCCEIFTGLVAFTALIVVWYYNSRRA